MHPVRVQRTPTQARERGEEQGRRAQEEEGIFHEEVECCESVGLWLRKMGKNTHDGFFNCTDMNGYGFAAFANGGKASGCNSERGSSYYYPLAFLLLRGLASLCQFTEELTISLTIYFWHSRTHGLLQRACIFHCTMCEKPSLLGLYSASSVYQKDV